MRKIRKMQAEVGRVGTIDPLTLYRPFVSFGYKGSGEKRKLQAHFSLMTFLSLLT